MLYLITFFYGGLMGYSHYWKMTEPIQINDKQKKLIKEILKDHKAILFSWDGNGKPEFTDKILSFNGDGSQDLDHESFIVRFDEQNDFEFCKTARKPYDVAICKILFVLSLSPGFTFSSDGDIFNGEENWKDAQIWFWSKGYQDVVKTKMHEKENA